MEQEPRVDEGGQAYHPVTGRKVCGARRKEHRGGWCGENSGHGTDHPGFGRCSRHLGSTWAVGQKGFRLMARAMGDPVEIDPAQAILNTVQTTAGHVAWLESKIAGFRFVEATKIDSDGVETVEGMTNNQMHWWKMYEQERDRLVKYSEIAIRSGLATRAVQLAEKQGELLAVVVDRILAGLQLTDAQLQLVPDVVPAAIRAVATPVVQIEGGNDGRRG